MIGFVSALWRRKSYFPKVALCTQRLVLRPPEHRDFEPWVDVRSRSRDSLESFEPLWPARCLEKKFFCRRILKQADNWKRDRAYSFLIFDRNSGELLGGININQVLRNVVQHASVGYWLDVEARGQGFMQEACVAILRYAFDDLELRRMNIFCVPQNHDSRKVIERVGFEREGYARNYMQINGAWQDHIMYGMTSEQFAQQYRAPSEDRHQQTG